MITHSAFEYIQKCIRMRVSHIQLSSPKRKLTVLPVVVLNVRDTTFRGHFMANPYYTLDIDVIRASMFEYVYTEHGSYDVKRSNQQICHYTGQFQDALVHHVYMPKILEVGDILLCSHTTFEQVTSDSEPVLV